MRVFLKYCQLSFIILLMGCAVAAADTDNKSELISPKEASAKYTEKKAVILDVRDDSEWNEQHIPGAIHIPLGQLNERLPELKQYKDSTVITQCKKGGAISKSFRCFKVGRILQGL